MARPHTLSDEALTDALAAHPDATAADLAAVLGVGQSTAQKRLTALEAEGMVRRTPGGRVAGVQAPDRWHAADAPAPGVDEPADAATAKSERLGRGALGTLVRDYLAARPKESFGPAGIGKALGRSQGAVSNALAAMAERGEVVLVADKPRRYRIAS